MTPASSAVPAPPKQASKPEKVRPRPSKVRVKGGQTLADIAREYGVSPAAIMWENNMTREDVHPGQSLKLPKP
jgi:LysM repeat protein